MKTSFKHESIEIEVESVMDANHEIEQAYLKAFDKPEVEKLFDSKGNVFKLVITNKT